MVAVGERYRRQDLLRLPCARVRLPALTLVLHVISRGLGHLRPVVELHHVERRVDAGAQAPGGHNQRVRLHVTHGAAHVDVRILVGQALKRGVISGRRLAVEEPRLGHPEGAGAHRHDERVLLVEFPQPGAELLIPRLCPDDDHVRYRRIGKAVVRHHRHAGLRAAARMNGLPVASHGVELERHLLIHVACAGVDVLEDFPGTGVIDHHRALGHHHGDPDLATLGRLQGAGVGNGSGRERDHYEHHADEDGEHHADHGVPPEGLYWPMTRLGPWAFAERTKNTQFLPFCALRSRPERRGRRRFPRRRAAVALATRAALIVRGGA